MRFGMSIAVSPDRKDSLLLHFSDASKPFVLQEPTDIPVQQVCPELANEAVDYEEPASSSSDDGGPLYAMFAVDTQTSQQGLDALKEAMLEVRLLSGATCLTILSQHVGVPPGLVCRHKLGHMPVLGAEQ